MNNNASHIVGKRVDHYQVLEHLARGGMADVYLAEDVDLQRKVALKVMLDALAADQQFAARFRREAQTVARLDHPNIVQVYSTGFLDSGQPYIAMQYIDGGSLHARLQVFADQDKLVPTEQALAIARQVAVALEVAHRAGIVHRDLKPANILLKQDGTPILVDLGIAAVEGGPRLTQTGNLIGTPNYMSPEQVRGVPLDGRSDLYSLGVILYELLSGQRPFEAESSIAILHKHVYESPPPLGLLRPDLSPQTLSIVETALQKEPDRRYQNANEMVEALREAIRSETGSSAVRRTTVWLPQPQESDLVSRRLLVQDVPAAPTIRDPQPPPGAARPVEPQPGRRFNPLWLLLAIVILVGGAGVTYLVIRGGSGDSVAGTGGDLPTRTLLTATPSATAVSAPATLPTATDLPTLPPLPTSTPTVTGIPPTSTPTVRPVTSTPETPTRTPPPRASNLPETIRGSDGKTMLLVPAGDFLMGSTSQQVDTAVSFCRGNSDGDPCNFSEFSNEMPQRTVFLDAFYVDETEVTNDEYRDCVSAGVCDPPASGSGTYSRANYYDRSSFGDFPVVYVSWSDARAYCAWADKRLPTEAEWEKAARGDDARLFPWGSSFDANRANTEDRGREGIMAVGQFSSGASPYGALDMAGNVWEYVEDWYDPDYYSEAPDSNPPGPSSSPSGEKVLRSGSYANFRYYARVTNRGSVTPNSSTAFRGFRCVMDAGS